MDRKPYRILLVDNDTEDHVLFKRMLEDHPSARFDLKVVADYGAALKEVGCNGHDICLVDHDLGDKNGLDLIGECRAKGCELPFVLLTGRGDPELDQRAMEAGASGYLEKSRLDAPLLERTIRYAVGHARDLQTLKKSEDYFRLLLENSRDVAIIIGPDGKIIYEAPSTRQVLGRRPGEMEGSDAFVNIHPDDRDRVRKAFQEVASRPGISSTLEMRMRHNDGSWRQIEGNAQNLLGDPLIRGIVVNYRDVTERRRVEQALQDSEKHFRALIENASEVVLLADEKGVIQYISPSVQRVLGYTPYERIGTNVFEIWDTQDALKAASLLKDLLAVPGSIATSEARILHKNGTWRMMEGTAQNLLHRPEIAGIVLNYRDVTERTEAHERLLKYERLAALGEIAAGLAHEVRNPLATILSTVQYLKTKALDPRCADDLETILIQGDRIRQLVNETLDYSKNPVLNLETVNARDLLQHSLMLAQTQFGPDHVKTRVIQEIPRKPPEIRVDRRHIESALVNLLLNSYQALAPEGGHIIIRCAIIKGEILLSVQDDGPGIKDEDLSRVFDPFYTTKKRGSGLGLSISQRMAQKHGGFIDVERLKPRGTAFTLRLPLKQKDVP